MVISLGGLGVGQLLLNLADPSGTMLFILVSVLVSVALIPIALTAGSAPAFETSRKISLVELYRLTPLGVVGSLVTGMTYGAIFGMAAVYASEIGLSLEQVSYFMASVLLGGVLLQWPLGRLSDIVNRRVVIVIVTLCAGAVSFAAIFAADSSTTLLVGLMCLYGGLALPLYSLCVAYINDYLAADQMVAASSTIVLLRGVGACIGPVAAALLMSHFGPEGFLWTLCGVHGLLTLFALYRMTRRATRSVEEQRHYPAVEPTTQSVATAIAMQDVRDARDRDIARWTRP
jgi:MFS family permease